MFTRISVQLKKKKKANVEEVMSTGETDKASLSLSAVVDTPAPSSEDSDSDREKVCIFLRFCS